MRPIAGLVARLDAVGTDDPDFTEGFPEDRCPLCEKPVVDHPCWTHRRVALVCIVAGWLFGRIEDTTP